MILIEKFPTRSHRSRSRDGLCLTEALAREAGKSAASQALKFQISPSDDLSRGKIGLEIQTVNSNIFQLMKSAYFSY